MQDLKAPEARRGVQGAEGPKSGKKSARDSLLAMKTQKPEEPIEREAQKPEEHAGEDAQKAEDPTPAHTPPEVNP